MYQTRQQLSHQPEIICFHRLHSIPLIRFVFASFNEYMSLFHFFYVFVFAKMMTLSFPSTCIQSMSVPGATNCSLPHQMQSYHVCLCLYPIIVAGCLYSIMFAFAFVFVHIIVFAEMIHTSEACRSLVQRIARGPCPATLKSALCHLRQGINS